MHFLKSLINISGWLFGGIMILIGAGIIILAFLNPPLQLQIAFGLIGTGFILLGLMRLKQAQNENIVIKRIDEIVSKLDEIQKELTEEKQKESGGIVGGDLITSFIKYYAGLVSKQKGDE